MNSLRDKHAVIEIGVRDLREGEDHEYFVEIEKVPNEASQREVLEMEVRARYPDVRFKTYRRRIASFIRSGAIIVAEFHPDPTDEMLAVAEPSKVIISHGVQSSLFGLSE